MTSSDQLPIFGAETTAEEVATVFSNEIKGKNVLITGTSLKGIGFETARVIAKHANLVIITGYNDERLKISEETLKKDLPSANIRRLTLDLSSLTAVRKAAAEVNAYSEPIHVLINNAAAPVAPFEPTVDGLDLQLATGHVGPFLFTKLIAPKILAAKTATYTPRVVVVSSAAHAMGDIGVDLAYLEKPEAGKYDIHPVYQQTKSANILFASELSRRAKGALDAYSLHPGLIMTNLNMRPETNSLLQNIGLVGEDGTTNDSDFIKWKSIPQGAATTVVAAFDPRLNDKAGAFLNDGVVANEMVAPHSSDPVTAEKLWEVTEKIVGEKFVF
ncbi:hypothetical protein C8R43DRAFT_522840 [Mycena crocata]|nr:hypothetical protein C8R43DRAFT_522840 [Mycena crocata]